MLVTFLSEPYGINLISTSFVKVLGKTLCLCIAAVAMDVVFLNCSHTGKYEYISIRAVISGYI
jgi:hypothetical protein